MGFLSGGLQELPAELTAYVAGDLDASSLGALRLTSKRTKSNFNFYFLQRIRSVQAIDLTMKGIERLQTLASSQDLKPVVHGLRIVCVYHHFTPASPSLGTLNPVRFFPMTPLCRKPVSPEENAHPSEWPWDEVLGSWTPLRTASDRQWLKDRVAEQNATSGAALCEKLTNALTRIGNLDELALEACVVLGPGSNLRWPVERTRHLPWRHLWIRTMQAFRITLSAIARAQIRLRKLVFYRDTNVCSIPIDQMNAAMARAHAEGFAKVASMLQEFSISISAHVISDSTTAPKVPNDGEGGYYGPRRICTIFEPPSIRSDVDDKITTAFFSSMTNVKSLYIHFHQTKTEQFGPLSYKELVNNVFGKATFPRLSNLTLQGLPVTSGFSEAVLRSCPQLDHLRLHYMFLDVNGCSNALETFSLSSVRRLYLSNLYSPQTAAPEMIYLL
ncbi:hypothetical protein HJFPF1_11076 [Paramyrothecium foliicola]|nr:hypothetical protein HJFPF1_11076 [Paramyrothecium foliicola]